MHIVDCFLNMMDVVYFLLSPSSNDGGTIHATSVLREVVEVLSQLVQLLETFVMFLNLVVE